MRFQYLTEKKFYFEKSVSNDCPFEYELSLRFLRSFITTLNSFCFYRQGYPSRRITCRWQGLQTTSEKRLIVRQVNYWHVNKNKKKTNINKQTVKTNKLKSKHIQTGSEINKETNREEKLEHVSAFRWDWVESGISLKYLSPPPSIRNKTTSRRRFSKLPSFPRLSSAMCLCSEFSLVPCVV